MKGEGVMGRKEVGLVRISWCDWSCLTLPAESQRAREMSGMGLPILFLDRGIENPPHPWIHSFEPSHMS